MGGRGSSGRVKGADGGDIIFSNDRSLISERETRQKEVDDALTVMRYIANRYKTTVNTVLADMRPNEYAGMSYYGDLYVNRRYFNSDALNKAYDADVADGFHPTRGNVSAMKALMAHELGHAVNQEIVKKIYPNYTPMQIRSVMDDVAHDIVKRSIGNLPKSLQKGTTDKDMQRAISKYAEENWKETIAESFADVYSNGKKANPVSLAIMKEVNKYFPVRKNI